MRALICALGLLTFSACVPPPGPMEKLTNAAYDHSSATRFGRMDIAAGFVVPHAQEDFLARHRTWGKDLRIVDVELMGLRLLTPDTAAVSMSVSWHRLDSTTIKTSLISQKWTSSGDGWEMTLETRSGGAPGLFAAPPEDRTRKADKGPKTASGQL
jgi:hypothetical protein